MGLSIFCSMFALKKMFFSRYTAQTEMCDNFLIFFVPYENGLGKVSTLCPSEEMEEAEVHKLPPPSEEEVLFLKIKLKKI